MFGHIPATIRSAYPLHQLNSVTYSGVQAEGF